MCHLGTMSVSVTLTKPANGCPKAAVKSRDTTTEAEKSIVVLPEE
jgi:hypothetical protein